ncbi:hypothetical protein AGOR_G00195340 [Albula goreensis]|uniref:Uncharacterized protein n=1 Tax=Albula goreensis TaxID=1534307 RepID=A0A8T3CRK8_9TELE|nr:hypothetical protein AGOR_G00195340 [Albula goreensis]
MKDCFLLSNPPAGRAMRYMDSYEVYQDLVKGIEEFKFEGDPQPCVLKLTSDHAVPIFTSPKGHVLLAAAEYGRGRIVVTSHEAYLLGLTASMRFIENAIEWLKPYTHAWVGVCGLGDLKDKLSHRGNKAKSVSNYDGTVGVFCRDAYTDSQVDELLDFVKGGGGLLIGGQAWWWSSQNTGADVQTSFPGNKLTGPAGIFFTNEYGEKGTFRVPTELPLDPSIMP